MQGGDDILELGDADVQLLGDLGDGGLVNALGEEAPLCRPNDGGAVLLAQLLLGHKAHQLSDSCTIYL